MGQGRKFYGTSIFDGFSSFAKHKGLLVSLEYSIGGNRNDDVLRLVLPGNGKAYENSECIWSRWLGQKKNSVVVYRCPYDHLETINSTQKIVPKANPYPKANI